MTSSMRNRQKSITPIILSKFKHALDTDDLAKLKKILDKNPELITLLFDICYKYLFSPYYINKTIKIIVWILGDKDFITFLKGSRSLYIIIKKIWRWAWSGELSSKSVQMLSKAKSLRI